MAWQDFNRNMSSIGDYLRQQGERNMLMDEARQKGEMDLQFAIKKAQAEAEKNPETQFYNAILNGSGATTATEPSLNPNTPSGVVPVTPGSSGPMGMGIDRNQLIKGFLEKKFGISPLRDRKAELEIQGLEQKQEETKNKSQLAAENVVNSATDFLATIQKVKAGSKYFGAAGPIPTLNPWGYERKEWEANVNKLLSQKIVDLMNNMKQASRTGATGFGQLNKSELTLLQNASTALNKGLSPEQALGYLGEMEKISQRLIKHGSKVMAGNSSTDNTNDVSGQLMEDANGNKAIVYPDGRIEEL